jgi:hypothetical protein
VKARIPVVAFTQIVEIALNKMVAIRMAMVAKNGTIIARVMGQVATILPLIGIPIAGWIPVTRDG